MKIFRIAALMALASLPFLLMKKEKEAAPVAVETDHIFDQELSAD